MFTVLCCADLYGEKVNLEVTLDDVPISVQELVDHLARVFSREAHAINRRHSAYSEPTPPFQVTSTFVYDDVLLQWTKLKAIAQLHEYDQLYVFQPQTQQHKDTQKDLPPPRPPIQSRATSIAMASSMPVSHMLDSTPVQRIQAYPSASASPQYVAGGAPPPSHYGTSTPTATAAAMADVGRVPSRSPLRSQLEEQRREEERLSQRLSSVRGERERLEREAQREAEEERRRRAAEVDHLLKRKEQEIWSHRDALARAEEEYQRFLAEKRKLLESSP